MVVVLSALSVSTFQPRDVGEEMNQGCPQTPRHTPSRGWLSLGRVTPGLPGSRVMLRQASSNERLFSIELLQSTEQLVLWPEPVLRPVVPLSKGRQGVAELSFILNKC